MMKDKKNPASAAQQDKSAKKKTVTHVSVINMGCSKNLVDSERLARRLADIGLEVGFDEEKPPLGSVVVVNTCGFIGDAKEESVDMLLEVENLKKHRKISGYYVMGCLSQRYHKDITEEFPTADGIFGKFDWNGIIDDIRGRFAIGGEAVNGARKPWERILKSEPYMAYVKIAEGCDRFCAYCAIPLITGRFHSRPIDEIVDEVNALAAGGTREINIIAQDLSSYGRDLPESGDGPLAILLERLAAVPGIQMIRLHYAYPSDFPYEILPVMGRHSNICKYLDIALQHIDDTVLSNMRRHITADETRALLARIRAEVPGIHIRTTMMTGFPGETEEAFERLLEFVKEQRFERLGAFAYCEEDDTYAARHFGDDIDEDVKLERLDRLMALSEEIVSEIGEQKVGSVLRVIVDSEPTESVPLYMGRTEFDSPEVDPCVFIESDKPLEIGKIYNVHIDSADFGDLNGHVVE